MKKTHLLFLTLLLPVLAHATVRYVRTVASGLGNGSTWANASADLQGMMNVSLSGDEVWVATGTYKPTQDPFGSTSPSDARTKTFYFQNGIKLYGGFVATGNPIFGSRNPATNPTILSGDLDNSNSLSGGDSYKVVLSVNDGNTTLLEGFQITNGNGNGIGSMTVEGQSVSHNIGGGLRLYNSSMTINQCVVWNNAVSQSGGGISAWVASPNLTNSIFYQNTANTGGGADLQATASLVQNCVFANNSAGNAGGAILANVFFSGNIMLKNCTVYANSTNSGSISAVSGGGNMVSISNSILWQSTTNGIITLNYCCYDDGTPGNGTVSLVAGTSGSNNLDLVPNFFNVNSILGTDGLARTADDGLAISACSPLMNMGTNTAMPTTDILGNGIFPLGGTKDMGAYEVQSVASTMPGAISGATSFCTPANGISQSYNIAASAGASSYTWTYSGTGVTLTPSGNSVSLAVSSTATSGVLQVAHNLCPALARSLEITPFLTPSATITANVACNPDTLKSLFLPNISNQSVLSFDGADDYATLPAAVNTNAFNSAAGFTVEAWVKPTAANNGHRLMDIGVGQNNENVVMALSTGTSGKPIFELRNGATVILSISPTSTTIPNNVWSHIAFTYDKVTGKAYILLYGGIIASGTATAALNVVARANAYVGKSNGTDALFSGNMDEIRVWSRPRTRTEILVYMNTALRSPNALEANYHCDENAPSATTASINGNAMTLLNGVAFANTLMQTLNPQYAYLWTGGSTGNSLVVNTVGDYSMSITESATGCNAASQSYRFIPHQSPHGSATASPTTVCPNASSTLSSLFSTTHNYTMNANAGVAFTDISATGAVIPSISDDSYHAVALPFTFNFDGANYNNITVSSNGTILFENGFSPITFTNEALPTNQVTSPPSNSKAVLAFWDDLLPYGASNIRTQQIGGQFIIQWTNYGWIGRNPPEYVTFQIVLTQGTNVITFVYQDVNFSGANSLGADFGGFATVGLNFDASHGVQYSYNSKRLANGQSIRFTPMSMAYAWTGPNGFASIIPNPTISSVTAAEAGTYIVTASDATGCTSTRSVNLQLNVIDTTLNHTTTCTSDTMKSVLTNISNQSVLQFDGVDDYGTFPAAVNTDAFNSAAGFTVEAWVNAAAPTFWERFIDVGNGQANDNIILGLTQYVSGRPIIHLRNGSSYILDITSSMVLPPNTWTHLAYTYNKVSGECFIYMNGNVVASGTVSTPLSVVARTNAYIGKSNWAADALFSGKMDEIRVWSYARSQADIQATMNFALTNAPSLVANYHCDENAPSMTTASINGNDMSLLNGTAFANTGMETLSPQYSFLWTGGSTNPTLATNASGAYTLSVTDNAYTCSQSNTENVTIQPLSNTNIAMVAFAHTTPQTGTTDYGVCDTLIATLQSTGASPASGSTTSKVWIDATQNPQFAKRHFEISPATGSTGRVTLYFTQTDFDDFNLQSPAPALLLPQNPTDATGIDNLKIEKFDGTSSDGSGAYFTYSGGITTLDPLNSDIVWNAAQSRWDVSFDVTSFSGFFAKTQNAPFPIELLSFSGENKGTYNLLQWQTVTEINNDYFEVERSIDAIAFTKIGKVAGAGNSNVLKNYELRDNSPIFGRNYYRLKQVDIDGKYAYSQVITISPKTDNFFSVYPNPAQQMVYIDVQNRQQRFKIVDALGKIVYEAPSVPPQIDLSLLSAGIYTFVVGEARSKVVKIAE